MDNEKKYKVGDIVKLKPAPITSLSESIAVVYGYYFNLSAIEPTTPAPLSEQKQDGETVEEVFNKLWDKHTIHFVENGKNLKSCLLDAFIEWQSQNTAKQIDQYKARIVELEAVMIQVYDLAAHDPDVRIDDKLFEQIQALNLTF